MPPVAEVARNYVDLRSYQRRLAIAQENLASQSETLQITEWRYQAGLAALSDVDQARTSREQTRAGIPDLEVGRAQAENRLAVLLGRSPGTLAPALAEAVGLALGAAGVGVDDVAHLDLYRHEASMPPADFQPHIPGRPRALLHRLPPHPFDGVQHDAATAMIVVGH